MTKFWLTAAIAGLAGGGAWLTAYSGTLAGLVLSYLAPAPMYMAALGLGTTGGVAAAAGGAVLVLLVGGPLAVIVYVLSIAAPATLLARQALLSRAADGEAVGGDGDDAGGAAEWYPPGLLTAWLAGVGMAGLAALALTLLAGDTGMEGTVAALAAQVAETIALPDPAQFARIVTPILPGLMIAAWMVMLVLNAALAQTVLVRTGRNLRPSPDIAALVLPGWIAPAGAVAAAVGLLAPGDFGYFSRNLVVVLVVPFFLQGLAIVHALTRRTAAVRPLLAIFYVLLITLGWLTLLVAILGLVDQIAGFRSRWEKNRGID